jgi:hypothetical protein
LGLCLLAVPNLTAEFEFGFVGNPLYVENIDLTPMISTGAPDITMAAENLVDFGKKGLMQFVQLLVYNPGGGPLHAGLRGIEIISPDHNLTPGWMINPILKHVFFDGLMVPGLLLGVGGGITPDLKSNIYPNFKNDNRCFLIEPNLEINFSKNARIEFGMSYYIIKDNPGVPLVGNLSNVPASYLPMFVAKDPLSGDVVIRAAFSQKDGEG